MKNPTPAQSGKYMSLAGEWSCELDEGNRGVAEEWYKKALTEHRVKLPGTTQTNGIGPVPAKKHISGLTPTTEYIGAAWYQREIELTVEDCKRFAELYFERCGWVSRAWLNDVSLGSRDSLVSPHTYLIGKAARPGKNRLTLMTDNSNRRSEAMVPQGDGSESIDLVLESDEGKRLNCGGHHAVFGGPCWNGVTGRMELQVREQIRIDDLQVYPDVDGSEVQIRVRCANDLTDPREAELVCEIRDAESASVAARLATDLACPVGIHTIVLELPFRDNPDLWDEFSPTLYRLSVWLKTSHGVDARTAEFGMRSLSQMGTQLAINGRKTFLRGALENYVHPLTGYAPTDTDYWLEIFEVNKAHGLNHVRFHTCCPPEAAFAAADRLGIILNVELPGCSGYEPADSATLDFLQSEALQITQTFGNHPSFCMLTMGNELLYDAETLLTSQPILMDRVARCRATDDRHWYCCTAHPYTDGRDDDFYVSAWPKGATWEENGEPINGIRWSGFDVIDSSRFNTRLPETAADYRDGIAGIDKPVITHEVGQWAVYPDISEAHRYTGVHKAYNLEIIKAFMKEMGTLDLADDFVRSSGSLSLLLYKEEIESALRTPGLAGFQLLGFHDHPPQGTSTIGIVTALREAKGIVTADEFRRFCDSVVPLARLTKRVFSAGEVLIADIDVANYSAGDLDCGLFRWQLAAPSGENLAGGSFGPGRIPAGDLTRVGRLEIPLSSASTATKAVLRVFSSGNGVENSWDLWIYPQTGPISRNSLNWYRKWDTRTADEVAAGGSGVLELSAEQIPGAIRGCFTPVFWNPIMKWHQHAFTMGILCDPEHPALKEFPTECYTNWQWWDILRPSRVLDIGSLLRSPENIVRMIDSFIGNRCLSVLFEVQLGKGRLLITTLDLSSDLKLRPAARQLRTSLANYVGSSSFAPTVEIVAADVDNLIFHHQQKPNRETRDEVISRMDIPMEGLT